MRTGEAERIALALREAHPDAEPLEADPAVLAEWIAGAGGNPADDDLVAAVAVAWEALLG